MYNYKINLIYNDKDNYDINSIITKVLEEKIKNFNYNFNYKKKSDE